MLVVKRPIQLKGEQMQSDIFQFILKLVSEGVVTVQLVDEHTKLVINDSQYMVKYFPSDTDHDFLVDNIFVVTDHDGTPGSVVNITGIQDGYYKHGMPITELKSHNFFIYKLTGI